MALSDASRDAWNQFLNGSNLGALHPLDEDRLFRFIATTQIQHDDLDIPALLEELETKGCAESVKIQIERTLEYGPRVIQAYLALR